MDGIERAFNQARLKVAHINLYIFFFIYLFLNHTLNSRLTLRVEQKY